MLVRFGVEVLILQRSVRLIPDHEPEIGYAIQDYFEQDGISVVTEVQLERLGRAGDTRLVHARVKGEQREFQADQILMAVGRQLNTTNLGLQSLSGWLTLSVA
jgi:mercuric reductase